MYKEIPYLQTWISSYNAKGLKKRTGEGEKKLTEATQLKYDLREHCKAV